MAHKPYILVLYAHIINSGTECALPHKRMKEVRVGDDGGGGGSETHEIYWYRIRDVIKSNKNAICKWEKGHAFIFAHLWMTPTLTSPSMHTAADMCRKATCRNSPGSANYVVHSWLRFASSYWRTCTRQRYTAQQKDGERKSSRIILIIVSK